MWKNWALYTQNANTRSQFWVQTVLEIGTILLHLSGPNFLIPYPRELVDPSF